MTPFGLMAEFETPDALVAAARRTYEQGYRRIDAFTPFPVEGLNEVIGFHHNRMPLIVLLGGVVGCLGGYGLQYFAMVLDYPLNTGGRPLHSWPLFFPVTFEMTILFAALAAVFGMFALNGLPMPYHPVFNVPRFETASRSRFFLVIEVRDPRFDSEKTRHFLESLQPKGVYEVEP
jgi:hypothetical protein